jgi:transposase-like protein
MPRPRSKTRPPSSQARLRPNGKTYPLALKLEAVRLVLAEGQSQASVARRLGITQRCVCHWLSRYRAGRLVPALIVSVVTVHQLEQLDQLRALEAVQAAWRHVFGPSDP